MIIFVTLIYLTHLIKPKDPFLISFLHILGNNCWLPKYSIKLFNLSATSQMWWHMPRILTLRRLKQEGWSSMPTWAKSKTLSHIYVYTYIHIIATDWKEIANIFCVCAYLFFFTSLLPQPPQYWDRKDHTITPSNFKWLNMLPKMYSAVNAIYSRMISQLIMET
jgi:hypothetical protein